MIFLLISTSCLLGLFMGSFLNTVIDRLPIMLENAWRQESKLFLNLGSDPAELEVFNLFFPASYCLRCKKTLSLWDKIPLLSFLISRGVCVYCHHKISWRYPSVELLTAAVSIVVVWRWGISWQSLFGLIFSWCLLALTFIDLEKMLLPDYVTLPLLWLGLCINRFSIFTDINSATLGAVAGYTSFWLIAHLFHRLTGRVGMAHGDFKLFSVLGAWLGWQWLPFILWVASVLGTVIGGMALFMTHLRSERYIPFGPYLSFAAWISLLFTPDKLLAF